MFLPRPRPAKSGTPRRPRRRRLALEDLEARVNPVFATWVPGGALTINYSDSDVGVQDFIGRSNDPEDLLYRYIDDDPNKSFYATVGETTVIILTGSPFDDHLGVSSEVKIRAIIKGEGGDDVITGGGGNDNLDGGSGVDTLVAQKDDGNYTVSTGSMTGDLGSDSLSGFEDAILRGGPGSTTIDASGWDVTYDQDGESKKGKVEISAFGATGTFSGGSGNDLILAGGTINGGDGDDSLTGGDQGDSISGGGGNDFANGNDGNDNLSGEDGDDNLNGGDGDDNITGGSGNNLLAGEGDNDTLDDQQGTPSDTGRDPGYVGSLLGGDGNDTLTASNAGRAYLDGGDGDDQLHGSTFPDGPWGDTITGGPGADEVWANSDNDIFATGPADAGYDLTGAGAEWQLTGDGTDTLHGKFKEIQLLSEGDGDHTSTFDNYPGNVHLTAHGGSNRLTVKVAGDVTGLARNTPLSADFKRFNFLAAPGVWATVVTDHIDDLVIQARDGRGSPDNPLVFNVDQNWFGSGVTFKGGSGYEEVHSSGISNVTLSGLSMVWPMGNRVDVKDIDATVLNGTPKADRLDASQFQGNAKIYGFGGNDTLLGGSGNDTLLGAAGDDSLSGGGGSDVLTGGLGNDSFAGGDSYDRVSEDAAREGLKAVQFVLTPTSLGGLGSDKLTDDVEVVQLYGTDGTDTFTVKNWKASAPQLALDGRGQPAAWAAGDKFFYQSADYWMQVGPGPVLRTYAANADTVLSATLLGLETGQLTGTSTAGTLFTVDESDNAINGVMFPRGLTLVNFGGGDKSRFAFVGPATGARLDLRNDQLVGAPSLRPIALRGLMKAKLIGGAGEDTFIGTGWTHDAEVDAGGGKDRLVVGRNADFRTDPAGKSLQVGNTTWDLTAVEDLDLTGGAGANRFTLGGWPGGVSVTGGAGNDTIHIEDQTSILFTLADARWTLSNGTVIDLPKRDVETAEVSAFGGFDSPTFDVGGWSGGGRLASGLNKAILKADGHAGGYTLTDASFQKVGGKKITLLEFDTARLSGSGGDDVFTLTGWHGKASLTGNGGNDRVVMAAPAGFVLADDKLAVATGQEVALAGITDAHLTIQAPGHRFDMSGWRHPATLTGPATVDVSRFDVANYTLTDRFLSLDGEVVYQLRGVTAANLEDLGTGNTTMNAIAFTGKVTLTGGHGADVLKGGSNNDELDGGSGNDWLWGGGGSDILHGRTGSDALIGGTGVDALYGDDEARDYFAFPFSRTEWKDFVEGEDLGFTPPAN